MATRTRLLAAITASICVAASAGAEDLRRATVWDLRLGQPIAAQPAPEQFRGFACGANGGPPRQRLAGWSDFMRCKVGPDGLHEIYFEYDDEYEYIARARDLPREIARWAGTTEGGFPVIVSALFDDRCVGAPPHTCSANTQRRASASSRRATARPSRRPRASRRSATCSSSGAAS